MYIDKYKLFGYSENDEGFLDFVSKNKPVKQHNNIDEYTIDNIVYLSSVLDVLQIYAIVYNGFFFLLIQWSIKTNYCQRIVK